MKTNSPITTILFLLISVVLFFMLIMPQYEEYRNLEMNLLQKRAQHQDRSEYYKQLVSVISEVESNQESLERINSALPESDSVSHIISFLQKESQEDSIDIRSVTFSPTGQPAKQQFKNISFTMTLFGEYKNFKKFLAALNNSARIFEVDIISFESLKSSGGGANEDESRGENYYRLDVKTHSY